MANVKVLRHCDGAIVRILENLIEIGVDIINPVQTVVTGMTDAHALKEQYGDRPSFHGSIDVQHVLPIATVDEVRREVARLFVSIGKLTI